jgi:hypothetical protein
VREVTGEGVYLLDKLDGLSKNLGFNSYTDGSKPMIDIFFITMALNGWNSWFAARDYSILHR